MVYADDASAFLHEVSHDDRLGELLQNFVVYFVIKDFSRSYGEPYFDLERKRWKEGGGD